MALSKQQWGENNLPFTGRILNVAVCLSKGRKGKIMETEGEEGEVEETLLYSNICM